MPASRYAPWSSIDATATVMTNDVKTISESRCFDGVQGVYSHEAHETKCTMRFALYMPPGVTSPVPALFWLSGLTCTEENFTVKAGAQRVAAELGMALVVPDTSPRGVDIPGDRDSYDFGVGAGFYVDATQPPWSTHYRMYSYVSRELPALIGAHFPVDLARVGISGHSMGGHGALTIALRNPDRFRSVSAFAPIASPMRAPWGIKAFTGYLGSDQAAWRDYDATALLESRGWRGPALLVDQGTADPFLATQLQPALLEEASRKAGVAFELRMREGYDHSYYFIATFIEEHLRFHARCLGVA
jgi:S-formylglutathione hydrolase